MQRVMILLWGKSYKFHIAQKSYHINQYKTEHESDEKELGVVKIEKFLRLSSVLRAEKCVALRKSGSV